MIGEPEQKPRVVDMYTIMAANLMPMSKNRVISEP